MRTLEEIMQDEAFWDTIFYSTSGARHYEKDYDEAKTCDYGKCKECGGKCCKRCGCFFSPDDFPEISFDALKKEIDKGYIAIEVVDGDQFCIEGFIRILRVRNVDDPIFIDSPFSHSRKPCILLTETGCKLDYEHRPSGGKLLIPGKKGNDYDCHGSYGTEQALREWKFHQKLLAELGNHYKNQNLPCMI